MDINKYYSLSLYANSILGTTLRGAKLVSILDVTTARKFASIDLLSKQVYPYLPPGTPKNINGYQFYLFNVEGKDKVIADYWIIPGSIEEAESVEYNITLKGVTTHELSVIRDQLRLMQVRFEIN